MEGGSAQPPSDIPAPKRFRITAAGHWQVATASNALGAAAAAAAATAAAPYATMTVLEAPAPDPLCFSRWEKVSF